MNKKNVVTKIKNPKEIIIALSARGIWPMSDEKYLRYRYYKHFHKELNLSNPRTFNEKLQWLKLYDHNPIYTKMVDKYEAKKYVASIIGDKYIIPTLGVWDRFSDIDFDVLPNQFVLKCTHDSGGLVIVKDKKNADLKAIKKKINRCLNRKYYYTGREWPYKNVKPRIIAEKFLFNDNGESLRDYKFFCFNGVAKALFVASDRNANVETKFDFFDMNFMHLDIINGHPNSKENIRKPITFDKMVEASQIISRNIPMVRVDFYEINEKMYFGEITFFHWSGFEPFIPAFWDDIFGSYIEIPGKEFRQNNVCASRLSEK